MKKLLLGIMMFVMYQMNAQSKLIFSYDASGNQSQRYFCTLPNCSPPPPPVAPLVDDTVLETPLTETIKSENLKFTIYPNPTDGFITVSVDSEHKGLNSIQVYDTVGRLIYNKEMKISAKSTTLDIKNYPAGIYLMRFVHEKGYIITKKIIKH